MECSCCYIKKVKTYQQKKAHVVVLIYLPFLQFPSFPAKELNASCVTYLTGAMQHILLLVGLVYQQHPSLCSKFVSVGWSKGSILRALQQILLQVGVTDIVNSFCRCAAKLFQCLQVVDAPNWLNIVLRCGTVQILLLIIHFASCPWM
jgi:hypothetical protein